MEEKNKVKTEFEVVGAEKATKKTKDYNKAVEENTQDTKENTQATDKNTNAQNKNNQAKSKGAKSNSEYSSALKSISSKLTLQNLKNMASAITQVARRTIELTKYSVDYIENLNLMDSAFGKNSEAARKWIKSISNIYGFDESTMTKQLGTFRQFGAALGFASDKADLLSKNLTLMAGDVSSLYNISFSQASEKLTSALTGQTKAIRSLGADITQASLQQELYRMGINESISDMNRAEKTLLIYLSLERQLANSQGDLAKTLESPSNQMKVFTEQVKRLARAIGNLLLPVLAAILPIVNGVMMALTELINLLGSLLGFNMKDFEFGGAVSDLDGISDGLDDISDSALDAGDSAKKLKKELSSLRGFDKLNVITTPKDADSSSKKGSGIGSVADGGINSKLLDALQEYNAHLDLASGKVRKIRDMILSWFGYTVNENGQLVKLRGHATKIQKVFQIIKGIIKDVYDIIADIIKRTIEWGKTDNAKNMYSDIADIVIILLGWVKRITDTIKELYLEYISPMIPDLLDSLSYIIDILKSLFEILSPIFEIIVEIIKFNLAAVLTGIGIALKIIKGTLDNLKNSFRTFIDMVKKLVEGDFKGAIKTMINYFISLRDNNKKITDEITDYFRDKWVSRVNETREKVVKKLEEIIDWFKNVPYRIGVLIGQITRTIIKLFTDPDYQQRVGKKIMQKILNGLVPKIADFNAVMQKFISNLTKKIQSMSWADVGKAIGEAILKSIFFPQYIFGKTINNLIRGIKDGLNGAGSNSKVSINAGGKSVSGAASLRFAAEGGFVDTGELFVAREAGPELVGSIGNKTAVANNDQIVQAVSIGVQNAIARSGIGSARVVIEAKGDSGGLMDFITFKQKQQERQYGL